MSATAEQERGIGMTLTDLHQTTFGIALVVSTSIVGVSVSGRGFEARSQARPQVPVVSQDPEVQQRVEAQLAAAASVRLDPNARVASLNFTDRPLRVILDAVATAGGITLRYASGTTGLDASSSVTLADQPVEDALRAVLRGQALTLQALGPKTALIYSDTPTNREKYTATIRAFSIAKADPSMLAHQLNRVLAQKPTSDGFRPMVLTVRDSRSVQRFSVRCSGCSGRPTASNATAAV
jgi:hypothetical protein